MVKLIGGQFHVAEGGQFHVDICKRKEEKKDVKKIKNCYDYGAFNDGFNSNLWNSFFYW